MPNLCHGEHDSPELPQRLDTFLRARAHLDRKQALVAIGAREVTVLVRGEVVPVDRDLLVFPEDEVFYLGKRLDAALPNGHWMLHKPEGVVCARRGSETPNLEPWLRNLPPGTIAVGRLDKATTGLLLLTTDGRLAYSLTHPQHRAGKVYRLTVAGLLNDEDARLASLANGVELLDGVARATNVRVISSTKGHGDTRSNPEARSIIELEVCEGRNRMVRRMARAAGLRLRHLHRVSVGPQLLGSLPPGGLRALEPSEADALYAPGKGAVSGWGSRVSALRIRAEKERASDRPDVRLEAWLARHCSA